MKKYPTIVDGLCDIFEKKKILKHSEISTLKKKFEHSDLTFEEFVIREGIIEKKYVLEALGELYEIPAIDVDGIFFDHHLVRMFPKDEMLRNIFIPYLHDGPVLVIIANNPRNNTLFEIAGRYVSYDVTCMVGLARDIIDAIEDFFDESMQLEEDRKQHDPIPEEVEKTEEQEEIEDIINNE